jgi:NTP pyrophosphatase (non-canonical NTP hydrolase)
VAFLTDVCHNQAYSMGWWHDLKTGADMRGQRNVGEAIALMHSELSEALEAHRKDKMDDHLPHRKGLEVELADALIRVFDFAGGYNLDLGGAVAEKLAYNKQRADHQREARIANNGKAF